MRTYFRDVNDHLLRVNEQLEGFRDLLTSVLEANLTQVGVRQNEDMRKISAWVAIVAVPTLIAGIYGMNFHHMPELRWQLGYPVALGADGSHLHRACTGDSAGSAGCRLPAPWPTRTASSARSWRASCPREIIHEDEHTVAFMDLNPWTRGHALVIPRRHSRNLYEIAGRGPGHAAVAAKRLALRDARPARLRRREPAQLAASPPPGRRSSTSTST